MSEAIVVVWLLGSAWLLIRLAVSYRSMQRLKHGAAAASEQLQARWKMLAADVGVRRQARLLVSDDVEAPMALGLFDPVILIPRSLPQQLSEPDLDHIALHELAHLRRYDDWMNLLQKLLEALLPIQPAMFWIGWRLALERETACDDWVIAATGTPKPYAASLTRIAELALWARCGILGSGVVGLPSQLFRRVQRLLDPRRNIAPRVSVAPLALAMGAVTVLAFVILSAPPMVALANSPQEPAVAPAADAMPDVPPATQPAEPGTQMQTFAVPNGGKLVVDVDRGNIHVATWNQSKVRIVVTQTGPGLAELLKHHHITMTQEGREVRVRAADDGMLPSSDSGIEIEYRIAVPAKFDAELRDGAGDAEVDGLGGAVDATTGAGNIDLERIDGPTKSRAGMGNIDASACHGPLQLITGSGNIDVKKIDGSVDGHTGMGNIDAADCTGALQASDGAGNIDIHRFSGPSVTARTGAGNVSGELIKSLEADSSLNTSMGNIEARLNPSMRVNLTASTSMGDVRSEFPIGPVNGGGAKLDLETRIGNIQIQKK